MSRLIAKLATVLPALIFQAWSLLVFADSTTSVPVAPLRNAYYGDLHLHTSYSFDAYLLGTTAVDPDVAYRFAKGEVIEYMGRRVQRREPLDFLAVTDHAENIGVFNQLEDPGSVVSKSHAGQVLRNLLKSVTGPDGRRDAMAVLKAPKEFLDQCFAFQDSYLGSRKSMLPDDLRPESRAAWTREIDFANRNYQPGRFTTFIAYEWTAMPNGSNLHRNVIFRGDSAPYPFTALDSKYPEDLWEWLEEIRAEGYEAIAIPHNANASNGLMYDWVNSSSEPISRLYAKERQANEPLTEISQYKGASETHPLLSPNDEFADYEIYDWLVAQRREPGRIAGSYVRDALSRGLIIQRQNGVNPYKYGFVGGSDLHSGLSVSAQADYGRTDFAPHIEDSKPSKGEAASVLSGDSYQGSLLKTTSGNLTGVWAESNTRESIFGALRRRETFATTGTRLKFRLFGGWGFTKKSLQAEDWVAAAYASGAAMGGDLPPKPAADKAPTFLIWAVKDPNGAALDRAQIIKVWEEDGKQKEKVFDVAWSGHRGIDPITGKLPPIGNTVDLKTGHFSNDIGASELKAQWKDPEFNSRLLAAYYLRVLEIPTPRWSTLLALQAGVPVPSDAPASVQLRGWSSPIWYTPSGSGAVDDKY